DRRGRGREREHGVRAAARRAPGVRGGGPARAGARPLEAAMSELGPDARAIVEAGRRGDDPTSDDRTRVRAALMRAVAAGGAGAAASAAGKGAAASLAPKAVIAAKTAGSLGKLVALVAVVSAVGGGYVWSRASAHPSPSVAATAAQPTVEPSAAAPRS